jgi:hypothetical protein
MLETRQLLSFAPAVNYPGLASDIATADFNGDGKLDIATAAFPYPGVFVRLGDGAGGFGARQEFAVTGFPFLIWAADVNHDTRPDLTLSDGGNGYQTLMGNGDGTFQPAVYTGGVGLVHVQAWGGGVVGVVTWTDFEWATHVQIYYANSQGVFTAWGQDAFYWGGGGGLAPVDLNNDGCLDVVTGAGAVLMGLLNGSLQYDHELTLPFGVSAVATGDFNGDSKPDAIMAGSGISVLRGKGDGTFLPAIHHTANGAQHADVATADFNADGKLDAIVTDYDTATVSVMLGNGDGTLRYFGAFATGPLPTSIQVGDFNRDGRPDVAVSNFSRSQSSPQITSSVWVLLNDGDWQTPPPPPPPPLDLTISDVTVTEGDTGTQNAVFTLTLSRPSNFPASVGFTNINTLTAELGTDFDYLWGYVDFAPGETSKMISIAVKGDLLPEPTETFAVDLLWPWNVRIADGRGIGTIINEDGKRWTGPASGGNWSSAANWSPGGVPTASDHVSVDGMSVNVGGSATVASLTLTGGATLNVGANGSRVFRTASLFLDSDTVLDLADNALILDYASGTDTSFIRNSLVSGRNGGSWNGLGITSTAAAAAPETTLGYAETADVFAAFPANFAGQSVDATSILVRHTLLGDANLDREVDVSDLGILASDWQQTDRTFSDGDFDYNGSVDVNDLGILATHWQRNLAMPSAPESVLSPLARRRAPGRMIDALL